MRSTRLIAFVLLAALAPDPASGQAPSPQSALDAYRRGDFQRSEAQYSELARKSPEDPRLRFNAGAAAYRRNDLTNAASWFEGVTAAPDLKLQQQAYYNLGNTRYRLGESATDPAARKSHWYHALTNYMSAIKLDGADTNASSNYSFVRQQLEQLERQQPPPQSSQSKDNKDKKQQKQEQQDSESSQDQKDQGKQEQQQDNSGSQQQQQQQGSQGSQQPDNESNQNGEAQEQEGANPEDSKEQAETQKPDKDPSKQGAQPQGPKPGDGTEGQTGQAVEAGEAQEGDEGTMSASQAVQMLESQKGEEKALLLRSYGSGKEAAERAARIRKPW